ncbi:MAG: DUF4139 domain-containing protein [Chlorobi bacterium]|nr:DUF4139 domain-containing protein [Chlorobiota bacterium]
MTIDDRYPLSESSSFEVGLLKTSLAKIDEKTGSVKWTLDLGKGETKGLLLEYSVKIPKYSNLLVE